MQEPSKDVTVDPAYQKYWYDSYWYWQQQQHQQAPVEEPVERPRPNVLTKWISSRYSYLFLAMLLLVWCVIFWYRGFRADNTKRGEAEPMGRVIERCFDKFSSADSTATSMASMMSTAGLAEVVASDSSMSITKMSVYFLLFVLSIHCLQSWIQSQTEFLEEEN